MVPSLCFAFFLGQLKHICAFGKLGWTAIEDEAIERRFLGMLEEEVLMLYPREWQDNVVFNGYQPGANDFILNEVYWQEARDPLHRYVKTSKKNPSTCSESWPHEYLRVRGEGSDLSFSQWMAANASACLTDPLFNDSLTVDYIEPVPSPEHLLTLARDGGVAIGGIEVEDGEIIGVQRLPNVHLYSAKRPAPGAESFWRYQHSSFYHAMPVHFAFTATVEDGKLTKILGKSGHYLPQMYPHRWLSRVCGALGDSSPGLLEGCRSKTPPEILVQVTNCTLDYDLNPDACVNQEWETAWDYCSHCGEKAV